MKTIGIVLIIILTVWILLYMLYRAIFCYPVRKHQNAHKIPENNALYRSYKEQMLKCVDEMECTPHEQVGIVSHDGYHLYGKLYSIKKGAPLVLFFHGFHGVPEWDGYGFFKICKQNKMNILMVEERTHGSSEGREITFGIRERYDCKSWITYVNQRFGENTDLILAGVSMGAATVLMASELGFPQNVRAIISDCSYTEPAAIVSEFIAKLKLPVKPVLFLVNLCTHLFGHFDLKEMTAVKAVQQLTIPLLFIHGERDEVVPYSMCEELYDNCKGEKEKITFANADHANSAMTDYAAYEQAVMQFLNSYLHGL